MLNNFIYAKTKDLFTAQLQAGNVLDEAIVFIEDTKEIWNHGTYFDGSKVDLSNIETSIQNILDTKQDNISDLETIRSGAALGATSVQPSDLATVAKTGSYDDLINKPDIPSEYVKMEDIPTKVSQLENDVPYITEDTVPNGVYAVDASGKLIDYNTADNTAKGVAIVAGEHCFMIAKDDATDGTNNKLYWGKNLYGKDVAGITNISSGAGYIGEGKTYGTDFTTWSTGPVVDFNGKSNTAAIINGYTEHGIEMDARDMCKVLETYNEGGYTDWYVPAAGQLSLMYLVKDDIDAALAKIGGTALGVGAFWSSSEINSSYAWYVFFKNGYLFNTRFKYLDDRVRFVRDISASKSLKEVVSELESSKQDIIEDLDAIRDGASKGATALQEEQYKGTVTSVTAGNGLTGGSIIDSGTISMPSVITAGTKGNSNSIQLIPSNPNCSATNASGKVIGSITVDEFGRVVDIKECFIDLKTIYPKEVTTSYSGLMTASDKSKLNQCITSSTASNTYATKTSLNNKQDKLVSGTSIKTINGESILGSGDIVIEGGSSSGSSSSGAYAEVNHGTGDTTFTLTPNTFHVWDEVASLDLSFAEETAGVANEYLFQFTSGATATTLTLPDGLKWANDRIPAILENMIYQISILKGMASALEFSNKPEAQLITFQYGIAAFQAKEGMTWAEWCDSEYNSTTLKISNDILTVNGFYTIVDSSGNQVYGSDEIIPNETYNVQQSGGG